MTVTPLNFKKNDYERLYITNYRPNVLRRKASLEFFPESQAKMFASPDEDERNFVVQRDPKAVESSQHLFGNLSEDSKSIYGELSKAHEDELVEEYTLGPYKRKASDHSDLKIKHIIERYNLDKIPRKCVSMHSMPQGITCIHGNFLSLPDQETCDGIFRVVDQNDTGHLAIEELRKGLQVAVGIQPTDKLLNVLVHSMSKGGRTVDHTDFLSMVQFLKSVKMLYEDLHYSSLPVDLHGAVLEPLVGDNASAIQIIKNFIEKKMMKPDGFHFESLAVTALRLRSLYSKNAPLYLLERFHDESSPLLKQFSNKSKKVEWSDWKDSTNSDTIQER
jgi:hypothetical protein